jgi:hypothetical protein
LYLVCVGRLCVVVAAISIARASLEGRLEFVHAT